MSEQHPAEKIAADHAKEQHKKGTKRRIGKGLDYYANKIAHDPPYLYDTRGLPKEVQKDIKKESKKKSIYYKT
jgi:hypothetical protein